jgi:fibronectin-binding autotransporter adhesin
MQLTKARSAVLGVFAVIAMSFAGRADAGTYYWYGSDTSALGGDGTWTTASGAYWSATTDSPSMTTWTNSDLDTAYFAGDETRSTVMVSGAVATGGMTFNSSGLYVLGAASSSGTLSIGSGGITANSSASLTFATGTNTVRLTASQTWTTAPGATLTIGSASGTGANYCIFLGNSGDTLTLGSGTLNVYSASRPAFTGGVTVNMTSGCSISTTYWDLGYRSTAQMVINGGTLNSATAIRLGNALTTDTTTAGGTITQNDGVVSTGVLYLANNRYCTSYSCYYLNGGTLNLSRTGNGYPIRAGDSETSNTDKGFFYFNGGLLNLTCNAAATITTPICYVQSGGMHIGAATSGVNVTLNCKILEDPTSTGGGLVKTGDGGLVISTATCTYTGDTTVSAGTLQIGTGGTAGAVASNIYLADNTTLIFNRSGDYSYGYALSGSGSVTHVSTGTLTLSGTSSGFVGPTTVSAGTLRVTGSIAGSNIGMADNTVLVVSSGAAGAVTAGNSTSITLTGGTVGAVSLGDSATLVGSSGAVAGAINAASNVSISLTGGTVGAVSLGGTMTVSSGAVAGNVSVGSSALLTLTGGTVGTVHLSAYSPIAGYGKADAIVMDDYFGIIGSATDSATWGGKLTVGQLSLFYSRLNVGNISAYTSTAAVDVTQSGGLTWDGQLTVSLYGVAPVGTGTATLIRYSGNVGGVSYTMGTNTLTTPRSYYTLGTSSDSTYKYLILVYGSDYPYWTGLAGDGGVWSTGTTTTNKNWKLVSAGTKTDYIDGDTVLFDDRVNSGTTSFAATVVLGQNVGPAGVTFNNSGSVSYTLTGGSGHYGIGDVSGGITTLTKNGAGTATLTCDNTYTGATTVNAGALQIGNGSTTGSIAGSVAVNGTLAFNRSDAYTFAYVISGSGSIVQRGAGTLTLTADNTCTGTTTIAAGTLQIGAASTTGALAGDVADNASLVFNRSDAYTFGHVISGSGSVVQCGFGTLTLTQTNAYTGTTYVNAGVLACGADFAIGGGPLALNGGTLALDSCLGSATSITFGAANSLVSGGTLGIGGGLVANASGTLATNAVGIAASQSWSIADGCTLTLGNVSSTAAIVISGSSGSTLTLNNNATGLISSFQPQFTSGMTVKFSNGSLSTTRLDVGYYGTATMTIDGGVLFAASSTPYVGGGGAGYIRLGNDNTSGSTPALGAGTITQNGGSVTAGVLYLANNAGTNSATSCYCLNGGTLTLYATGSGYPIRSGSSEATNTDRGWLYFNGGLLNFGCSASSTVATANFLVQANGANIAVTTSTATITLSRALLEDSASTGGGLTKSGAGALRLSGTNTFTGDTKITGGTLLLGSSLALQYSTLNYGDFGGSLSFGALTAATFGGLKGTQALALANSASSAVALTVGGNNASTVYSGALSGAGSLTKTGTGTLTLSGANTYTGTTYVNSGFLVVQGDATSAILSGTSTDIGAGKLVFSYSDTATGASIASTVSSILTTSYNGGTNSWASGVIHSTLANTNSTNSYALGWSNNTATSAVTVNVVLYGDATMDGTVNIYDLGQVLANYNKSGVWATGDFNYDGTVNIYDLGTVLANYNKSLSLSGVSIDPSDYAGLDGQGVGALQAAGVNVVPEPGTLALLIAGAIGLLVRAWRKWK